MPMEPGAHVDESWTVTSRDYSIDIEGEQLLVISRYDNVAKVPLYVRLGEVVGIWNVDYDGHFGPHIFVSVEANADQFMALKQCRNHIEEYIDAGIKAGFASN